MVEGEIIKPSKTALAKAGAVFCIHIGQPVRIGCYTLVSFWFGSKIKVSLGKGERLDEFSRHISSLPI